MVKRYSVSLVVGAMVTVVLLFIMQAVISTDESGLNEAKGGKILDFVRLQEDEELVVKQRKPKPPPPPDEPPPNMPKPTFDATTSQGVEIGIVQVDVNVDIQGTGGFSSDGEYLPIVKVAPMYPRRAAARGIEGYVLLEFTVTKTGAVRDPKVLESKPPGIFDRAAMNASLKFKYKPKVVNGEPIEVSGVRNRITFELTDA